MIVTVEGYQGKKNRSALVATAVASMSAMKYGEKTLAINLIDNNTDSIERLMLNDAPTSELRGDVEASLSEDGIDQLLREADVKKLLKSDFDKSVRPALALENRLDVATITQNDLFTVQLEEKKDALVSVLQQAKEIYDNVIILMKTTKSVRKDNKDELALNAYELIKELVDVRIVCVRQGCKKKYDLEAKKLVWLITDYDDNSRYDINTLSKDFIGTFNTFAKTGNKSCLKLPYSTQANDACISGTVLKFVRNNRDAIGVDVNYGWVKAMESLCVTAFGKKDIDIAIDWENAAFLDSFQPKRLSTVEDAEMELPVERMELDLEEDLDDEPKKPSRKDLRKQLKEQKEAKRKEEEERRKKEEEEERKRQEELARIEAERIAKEEEARLQRELAEAMERQRQAEEEERKRKEEEERKRKEEEERKRKEAEEKKRKAEEEILRLQEQLAKAQQNAAEATLELEQKTEE